VKETHPEANADVGVVAVTWCFHFVDTKAQRQQFVVSTVKRLSIL
jgi:hypothetical protein